MRIAICEDRAEDRDRLVRLLNGWMAARQLSAEVRWFESGEHLLAQWEPGQYQILFMDIYLPGRTGIKTVQKLREKDAGCAVILTTLSAEHGLDGFAVGAVHYLLKPVQAEALSEALERCQNVLQAHARYLEVSENRVPVRILLRDISHIEVMGNNCIIYTPARPVKVYATLEGLAQQLDETVFLRCHRSFVVNLQKVERLKNNEFVLQAGQGVVPVGRAWRAQARAGYDAYLAALVQGGALG
ncbi:MAG: LytR/AlgR family response regulator transcription factor [Oscillospiraceae bacterium]